MLPVLEQGRLEGGWLADEKHMLGRGGGGHPYPPQSKDRLIREGPSVWGRVPVPLTCCVSLQLWQQGSSGGVTL